MIKHNLNHCLLKKKLKTFVAHSPQNYVWRLRFHYFWLNSVVNGNAFSVWVPNWIDFMEVLRIPYKNWLVNSFFFCLQCFDFFWKFQFDGSAPSLTIKKYFWVILSFYRHFMLLILINLPPLTQVEDFSCEISRSLSNSTFYNEQNIFCYIFNTSQIEIFHTFISKHSLTIHIE